MSERLPFCSDWRIYLTMAALAISGCGQSGSKSWPVTGKVTFQGKPVSAALIRFSNSPTGVDIMARLDDEGKYTIVTARGPGLPEETYAVSILPRGKETPIGPFVATPQPNRSDIPEKYRQPTTSGLTMIVKSEANVFDVEMLPRK